MCTGSARQNIRRTTRNTGATTGSRATLGHFRLKDLGVGEAGYRISFYGDMMAFYGEYLIGVFSIDQNYYNYLYRDHPS